MEESKSNNSTLRSRKSREKHFDEQVITNSERNRHYSELSPAKKHIMNSEKLKHYYNRTSKQIATLNSSYHSTSFTVQWDYKNPCEL